MNDRPIVTERTGKDWKTVLLAGVFGSLFGLVLAVAGSPLLGALIALAGLVTIGAAKAGAWWHHG